MDSPSQRPVMRNLEDFFVVILCSQLVIVFIACRMLFYVLCQKWRNKDVQSISNNVIISNMDHKILFEIW